MTPKIPKSLKTKQYYKIGEVAQGFGVEESLIRYWEREFEILAPSRTLNGARRYERKDIENTAIVYHLVKVRLFTLDGAKLELKRKKDAYQQKIKVREELFKIKEMLEQIKAQF